MASLTIKPKNPRRHSAEELADLATAMRGALPDLQIDLDCTIPEDSGLVGVTWWEVLQVYLHDLNVHDAGVAVGGYVLKTVQDVFVAWAKERFVKRPTKRMPKYVEIYGPDGSVVSRVTVQSPNEPPKIE